MVGPIFTFILLISFFGLGISWTLHFYFLFKFQKLKRGETWKGLGSFFDFNLNMIRDFIVAGLPLIASRKEVEPQFDTEEVEAVRKRANRALMYTGIFLVIMIIYIVFSSLIAKN